MKNTRTNHPKYNHTKPTTNIIKQNRLFFDDRIKPEKLRSLFNQYVYAHYDNKVMNEYLSPDELDNLGYAFMEIQKVIRL